ncbi:hypothetical protein EF405_03935 [Cyclobacteriaceae bacterium YHN15]|nr:hypothetical protein EF405_03935 [Cyclobacteriaceae bacterium YHN15]
MKNIVQKSLFFTISISLILSCKILDEKMPLPQTKDRNLVVFSNGQSYNAVEIGEQYWFTENLRSFVPQDDREIIQFTENQSWVKANKEGVPGYSYYENDPKMEEEFGKIYNIHTLTCCRVCPDGWHVSTVDDWEKLEMFLGNYAGDKLKSSIGWGSVDSDLLNESGFSAKPAGFRLANGFFYGKGQEVSWWTSGSKEVFSKSETVISLKSGNAEINYETVLEGNGYYVRCVKD